MFAASSWPADSNAVMVLKKLSKGDGDGGGGEGVVLPMRPGKGPRVRLVSRVPPPPSPGRFGGRPGSKLARRPPTYLWTEWAGWSNCSRRCGGGVAVRTRRCFVPGTCG